MSGITERFIEVDRAGMEGQVAVISLNRERANAMTPVMAEQLLDAIRNCEQDPKIRGMVLTGKGRYFCVGIDAETAAQQAEQPESDEPFGGNLRFLHAATLDLLHSNKPVVAALNGSASAGGLDLALACDYRVCVPDAKLNESYIKVGLPPLNGGAWLLRRLVGSSKAAFIVLTGESVDGKEALRIGMVDELHSSEHLVPRAITIVELMIKGSSELIAFNKAELRAGGALDDALARVYVAGVTFARSDAYHKALASMPGSRAALSKKGQS